MTPRSRQRCPDDLLGNYFAFVVTDFQDVVFELDNANNVLSDSTAVDIQSQPADLVVSDLTLPSTGNSGETILVSWTVDNNGIGDTAVNSWLDELILSADAILGNADDVQLALPRHTGLLDVGESYSVVDPAGTNPADDHTW